jgi:hypothetical protein
MAHTHKTTLSQSDKEGVFFFLLCESETTEHIMVRLLFSGAANLIVQILLLLSEDRKIFLSRCAHARNISLG